uniref:Uncharacterized protein n=1 Tax=Globisporangium ultimum (strain ATCC 200006 / CBS 805.95 / DAOM BR144) TaxID=431595 RepID=K3X6I1_GLOUD
MDAGSDNNGAGVNDERDEIPHYMLPNFSSLLPEYANAEADQIRSAFVTNNYTSIQKIPAKLLANAVNQARFEQMDENRLAQPRVGKIVTKNGLFNQFEYTPSRFSLADELAQMERLQSEAKRTEISGRDFVSCPDGTKTKFEDAFGDKNFRYPHLYEPYPDTKDEERHKKWLEDKKILYGAFVPSGMRLPVDAVTRKMTPEIIKELHEVFAADWQGVDFSIAMTDDENLAVRFDAATLECESGLIAYMNVFVRSHRVTSKYNLQKVAEDWNSKPGDGGLYFMLRP